MNGQSDLPNLFFMQSADLDGVPVVTVAGEVDVDTAAPLAAELATQLKRRPPAVIVDLSAVSYFGSTGINLLLDAHGRAANRRVGVHVVVARPHLRKVLRITGVDVVLAIHACLQEALRAVSLPGSGPGDPALHRPRPGKSAADGGSRISEIKPHFVRSCRNPCSLGIAESISHLSTQAHVALGET